MPPAWLRGPQEERGLGGAGGQGGQRAHHLCRPLCWQLSSPCIAVIQSLVLGMQMSFQMPSAPTQRSSNWGPGRRMEQSRNSILFVNSCSPLPPAAADLCWAPTREAFYLGF